MEYGQVDIFSLARHGRVEELRGLLERGDCDVHDVDEHGNTILLVACQNEQRRVARLAVKHQADVNAANNQGNTGLHFCHMYSGQHESRLALYLLDNGADPFLRNAQGQRCTEVTRRKGRGAAAAAGGGGGGGDGGDGDDDEGDAFVEVIRKFEEETGAHDTAAAAAAPGDFGDGDDDYGEIGASAHYAVGGYGSAAYGQADGGGAADADDDDYGEIGASAHYAIQAAAPQPAEAKSHGPPPAELKQYQSPAARPRRPPPAIVFTKSTEKRRPPPGKKAASSLPALPSPHRQRLAAGSSGASGIGAGARKSRALVLAAQSPGKFAPLTTPGKVPAWLGSLGKDDFFQKPVTSPEAAKDDGSEDEDDIFGTTRAARAKPRHRITAGPGLAEAEEGDEGSDEDMGP